MKTHLHHTKISCLTRSGCPVTENPVTTTTTTNVSGGKHLYFLLGENTLAE